MVSCALIVGVGWGLRKDIVDLTGEQWSNCQEQLRDMLNVVDTLMAFAESCCLVENAPVEY